MTTTYASGVGSQYDPQGFQAAYRYPSGGVHYGAAAGGAGAGRATLTVEEKVVDSSLIPSASEKATQSMDVSTDTGVVSTETPVIMDDDALTGAPRADEDSDPSVVAPADYSQWVFDESELSLIGSPCEVKCDDTFAFYDAYIVDFNIDTQSAVVSFTNGWKPTAEVTLEHIRPRLPPVRRDWFPLNGDIVECLAKADMDEPFGFWEAEVLHFNEGLFTVRFAGWGDSYDQCLGRDMIRPQNTAQVMDFAEEIFRLEIDVPVPLENAGADRPLFHDELHRIRESTGVVHLGYTPPQSAEERAKVIIAGTDAQIRDCRLLVDYLFILQDRMLELCYREKLFDRLKRLEGQAERLRHAKQHTFSFDPAFTRFVIGRGGQTVNAAKKTRGVLEVTIDDGTCTIWAETDEAAKKCRAQLEFIEEHISIPEDRVGDLVGRGGENIRKIEKNSHVVHILSEDRHNSVMKRDSDSKTWTPGFRDYVIFGMAENIEIARQLIGSSLETAEKEREMRQKSRELESELRSTGGGFEGGEAEYPRRTAYDYKQESHFAGRETRETRETAERAPPAATGPTPKQRRRRSARSRASEPRDKSSPWSKQPVPLSHQQERAYDHDETKSTEEVTE
jgi:hypothetical protein